MLQDKQKQKCRRSNNYYYISGSKRRNFKEFILELLILVILRTNFDGSFYFIIMAENKKSVLLYCDIINTVEKLDDETAGKLFKHYLNYINDLNPKTENLIVEIAFEPIKQNLKRDLLKWKIKKEGYSKAGKASAEAKRIQKEQSTNVENVSTKSTNVENVDVRSTKSTVKDNVNVTVNVTDTVNVKDTVIKERVVLLSSLNFQSKEINQNEFNRIAFSFWKLFKENSKTATTKNLDNAKLEDWAKDVRLMIDSDRRTLEEIQSVFKFLKVSEFWKSNIQSIKKLREQFEKLYLQSKQSNDYGTNQLTATERNRRDSAESTKRMLERLQIDIDKDQQK